MEQLKRELTRILQQYAEDGFYSNAVIAVCNRERVCFRLTYGETSPESVFDLASLTKLYTTTVLLKLLQERDIGVDTPVLKMLETPEECRRLRARLETATIRKLLTHTAGLPAWYPLYAARGTRWERMELALASEGRNVQPEMCYSDLGFMLAGWLAEQLAGKQLPELMETMIRKPLRIPCLTYLPHGNDMRMLDGREIVVSSYGNEIERQMCEQRGICFDGFRSDGRAIQGEANDGNAWYCFQGVSGHAGLFSDAAGVSALGQFYLNTEGLLLREALCDQGYGRGLGFELGKRYPCGCGHNGFTGTILYLSRELGVGGVLLTNRLANHRGAAPNLENCRIAVHTTIVNNAAWIAHL